MMRKIGKCLCGFLGALMLFGLFPVQAQAASVMEGARIYDDYDLLSAQEEEELEAYAAGIIEQYQMDCVFVSSDGLGGKTPEEYADDFYDENGFGVGDSKDGTLFLVDMAERKFHISTTGKAIDIIDDDRVDAMVDQVQHFLKNGRYYDAVGYYMSRTAYFYEKARMMEEEAALGSAGSETGEAALGETGESAPETEKTGKDAAVAVISQEVPAEEEAAGTNGTDIAEENDYVADETQLSEEETTMFPVTAALISGGFLIFLIVKHKTVRREKGAANYLERDSIHFTRNSDIFLRSNTVKSKIQRDEDRSGSSGRSTRNRSTTHRSSSGRRHGGGGGSF